MFNRRDTLKSLLVSGAAFAMPRSLRSFAATAPSPALQTLKIPPIDEGELQLGVRHFDLTLQQGVSHFFPDRETPTWGINGNYLGPTLRMREGDKVAFAIHNALDENSILHWHGMDVPAAVDGGPHQNILPGGTWSPNFKVKQAAASCWYHSHAMHKSGPQVYRGLAGMLIVDDQLSTRVELPNNYGVDDIPLIIQDRLFDENAHFVYPERMQDRMVGVRGDTLLVNGTLNPGVQATSEGIRLRILNACNARNLNLALSHGEAFWQIATDCGLLEAPVELRQLVLSPGERAEILIDTRGSTPFQLISGPVTIAQSPYYGLLTDLIREIDSEHFDILTIVPTGQQKTSPLNIPKTLRKIDWLPAQAANTTRTMRLQMGSGPGNGGGQGGGPQTRRQFGGWGGGNHSINGRKMDMNYIEATIIAGTTEIWEIFNETPIIHPFHIHKVHFQILERNGEPALPSERGFKDTVNVPPQGHVKIIAHFKGPGDPLHPYMFHCHILEHEDHGMMGQFILI